MRYCEGPDVSSLHLIQVEIKPLELSWDQKVAVFNVWLLCSGWKLSHSHETSNTELQTVTLSKLVSVFLSFQILSVIFLFMTVNRSICTHKIPSCITWSCTKICNKHIHGCPVRVSPFITQISTVSHWCWWFIVFINVVCSSYATKIIYPCEEAQEAKGWPELLVKR